ncbi:hypothetical protein BGW80DRAFT_241773 [Lactifluus volemus]|nr:hypothetical protein BGW80DRAFT_241773 [Lactifluus volemus]
MIAWLLRFLIVFESAVLAYQYSDSTYPQTYATGHAMLALACISLFFSVTAIVAPMLPVISRPRSDRWVKWHRTISLIVCAVCFIAQSSILVSGIQYPSSESYQAGIMVVPLIRFICSVISRRKPDEAHGQAHTQPMENQASKRMNGERAKPKRHESKRLERTRSGGWIRRLLP